MSPLAARIVVVVLALLIILVGSLSLAASLLGFTWSLAAGGVVTSLLGLLWLAAWVVYYLWA